MLVLTRFRAAHAASFENFLLARFSAPGLLHRRDVSLPVPRGETALRDKTNRIGGEAAESFLRSRIEQGPQSSAARQKRKSGFRRRNAAVQK
jgi:hypothetical protein